MIFIGNLKTADFASRWKRELAPDQVYQGKKLAKQIKQSYSLSDKSSVPGKTLSPRDREQGRLREKIYEEKDKAKRTRKTYKVNNEPLPQNNRKITTIESGYGDTKRTKAVLTSTGESRLGELREKAAKRRPPQPTPITSVNQSNKFLGKAKKFIGKNKVGLGIAGAATLGAIGYGVARKIRSDKGRKRK
jgi:hypothetical protein